MTFLVQHGLVVSALLALCGALTVAVVFAHSLRRFEIMAGLVWISPWAHWLTSSNEELRFNEFLEFAESTEISTYVRMAIILVAGLAGAAACLRVRSRQELPVPPVFTMAGAFFGAALVTTWYSINPAFTFIRASEAIVFLAFLLGLYAMAQERSGVERILALLTVLSCAGLVINAAALVFAPSQVWWWQSPNRYQGITGHPNMLGGLCMIAISLLMWRYRRSAGFGKTFFGAMFGLAWGLLLLSGSRSSIGCAVAAVLLWHVLLGQGLRFSLTAVVVGVPLVLLSAAVVPSLERDQAATRTITDLTGREQFWGPSLALIGQRPLRGYGYEVGGEVWTDPRFSTKQMESTWGSARTSLHNGYLNAVIGMGLVGGLVWMIILVLPLIRALHLPPGDLKAVVVIVMVQCLLSNFVETAITSSRGFTSVAFWCFWALCCALPAVLAQPEQAPVPRQTPVHLGRGVSEGEALA